MRSALSLAVKDLRLLSRDRIALFWVLAFPLLFALLFGAVMEAALGGDLVRLPVVAIDDDHSPESARLLAGLEASEALGIRRAEVSAAEDAVRRAEAIAFVRIPRGYGASPTSRPPALIVGIDPSRRAESAFLAGLVSDIARRSRSHEAPSGPEHRVTLLPLGSRAGQPRSGFELAFPAAMLWGLMGCAATFAISIVAERSAGTLLRLRAAPINRIAILAGKALACFIASVVTALLLVLVGFFALGVEVDRPLALFVAIASASACFAGITLALALVGKSEQSVAGAGWATLIIMAMAGGAMVPLSVMPEWLRRLSDLSPVKWGILALEGALWRGFGAAELLRACALLVAAGAIAFLTGFALFRRSEA